MKKMLLSLYDVVKDVFFENSDGNAKNRRLRMLYTCFTGVVTTVIMGTYLTGLMIEMGADDDYISLSSALTNLCSVAQLAAPIIFERMRFRKRILVAIRMIYQFMNIVLIGVIPLLPIPKPLMHLFFMTVIVALNLANAISLPGISIWQMQCIPDSKHSNYFTTSSICGHIIAGLSAVIGGNLVDGFTAGGVSVAGLSPKMCAFLTLRLVALVFCIFEIICMIKMTEEPYDIEGEKRKASLSLLIEPLKNSSFMKTVSIYVSFQFVSGLVGQYFNIYLIEIVKVPYTLFSYSLIISMPFYFVMIPIFSRLVNKYTWNKVLPFLIFGTGCAYIFNMLITLESLYFYHFVMVVYYMFAPSLMVVFSYLPYTNMPNENRTSYISFFTISGIIAVFLGNLCGMMFMNITDGFVLDILGKEFVNYQYLNLLQTVLFTVVALYAAFIGKRIFKK